MKHLNEFEDCDFLATTPTITSGISFNKKNHFYRVYGYVTSDSNSYRSYVQQINRIRYITTNEYYVFIQPRVLSMNSCVPFTLSECLSLVEYNRLVSFGKLKKSDIDKLENVIDTSITLVNENKYEYAPIAKWLSAITLRETLDTRYRYFNALKTVLEFHGITCIVDTSSDDSITKGIIHNLNNTIDFNESKNMQLVIDAHDITEEIYLQNIKNMKLDDERSCELHKYRVKQMFRLDNRTVKFNHIIAYNNASTKWKIRNQLEYYDLLNSSNGDIDSVFKTFQGKYESHVNFVCSGLYNEFGDNNSKIRKVLALDILKTMGFEGPHNFDAVIDKQVLRDKFDSQCNRICEDYFTLISGDDMEFPSHEWDNQRLFAWTNCITDKTYGVHVALENKNTRCGRDNIVLFTEVPTPFHFIPNAYETFGFSREISTFESGKNTDLLHYLDDTITCKPKKTVVDLDTWLSENVIPGNGYITSQEIHKIIESKGLGYSRDNV